MFGTHVETVLFVTETEHFGMHVETHTQGKKKLFLPQILFFWTVFLRNCLLFFKTTLTTKTKCAQAVPCSKETHYHSKRTITNGPSIPLPHHGP